MQEQITNNEKKCCGAIFACGYKHMAIRIVILLALCAFVFMVGMKVGEFREGRNGRFGGDFDGRQDFGGRASMMQRGLPGQQSPETSWHAYRQGYLDGTDDANASNDDQGYNDSPAPQAPAHPAFQN